MASVNLRVSFIPDSQERPRPLNYEERTQMVLKPEEDILQQEMHRFSKEEAENGFLVNIKKCYIMKFSRSRKFSFPAEFRIGNSEILDVFTNLKILGIQIQSDLK